MQPSYVMACAGLCVAAAATMSAGTTRTQSQSLYQEIGQELLAVRKEYTQLQPRIYTLLDKIERLHGHLKTALNKKQIYKKEKATISSECKKLQEEAACLQASLETTSLELEQARVDLDQARQKATAAAESKQDELEATLSFTQQPLKMITPRPTQRRQAQTTRTRSPRLRT